MTAEPTASARVDAAFAAVPRAGFLPAGQRQFAGLDRPLPIGHDQTNSQPRTVRDMLLALDAQPGHRVLDVGAGSGWTTALLAHLVGPGGRVLGVERIPSLARWGSANLSRAGCPWARIELASPGILGDPGHAPYDRILVSAMAHRVPAALVRQLTPDGVLVVPARGELVRVSDQGRIEQRLGRYVFVPLVESRR